MLTLANFANLNGTIAIIVVLLITVPVTLRLLVVAADHTCPRPASAFSPQG
jgi:hypothetical protein